MAAAFKILAEDRSLDPTDKRNLLSDLKHNTASVRSVKLLRKSAPQLYELAQGSNKDKDKVNEDDRAAPNPELVKRREYLRLRQQEREYNTMVYGTDLSPAAQSRQDQAGQLSSFKNQALMGVNMIVAIVATFGMAFYIARQLRFSTAESLALGIAFATIMMIIEMILFISRSMQVEKHFEKTD